MTLFEVRVSAFFIIGRFFMFRTAALEIFKFVIINVEIFMESSNECLNANFVFTVYFGAPVSCECNLAGSGKSHMWKPYRILWGESLCMWAASGRRSHAEERKILTFGVVFR